MSCIVQVVHTVACIARVDHAVSAVHVVLDPMILGVCVVLHEVRRISSLRIDCYSHVKPCLQKPMRRTRIGIWGIVTLM